MTKDQQSIPKQALSSRVRDDFFLAQVLADVTKTGLVGMLLAAQRLPRSIRRDALYTCIALELGAEMHGEGKYRPGTRAHELADRVVQYCIKNSEYLRDIH